MLKCAELLCMAKRWLHWPTRRKNTEPHLTILFLQTLLYTFLFSVSPRTKKFQQQIFLKFQKSSYLVFLKSKQRKFLSDWQTSEVFFWYAKKGAFAPCLMKKKLRRNLANYLVGILRLKVKCRFYPLKHWSFKNMYIE